MIHGPFDTAAARGTSMSSYRWARWGDINAFFGLMLDNMAVMIVLVVLVSSATLLPSIAFPGSSC